MSISLATMNFGDPLGVARDVNGGAGAAEVVARLCDLATHSMLENAACIWTPEDDRFIPAAHAGLANLALDRRAADRQFGECWLYRIAASNTIVIADVRAHRCPINAGWMARHNFATSASIRLVAGRGVVGLLTWFSRRPARWTPHTIEHLRSVAMAAALAIDYDRLRRCATAEPSRTSNE